MLRNYYVMRLKSKWLAFTINIRPKFAKSVKFTLVTGLGAGTQSDPSVPGVGRATRHSSSFDSYAN